MSLIAHYKLDGNANDAFGKYNGTANNVTWVDGKLGQAGSFTTSSVLDLPIVTTRELSEITISFWANVTTSLNSHIFTILDSAGNRTVNIHLIYNNVRTYWDCGNNGSIYNRIDKASPSGILNQWHHWTFWKNANTGVMRIYLDGVLWHEGTGFFGTVKMDHYFHQSKAVYQYNGLIDDVRIYDHALSEREVRDLSQGLVLHYTFDQFQEPTENKASGVTYTSYAPYNSISGDASRVVMTCAATNPYMTIAGFGTLQGNTITVSGYMKKNGASYLPPLDKTSTYETATAVKHVMYSSTGRFEVTQVYNSTSAWLFHTPITAVAGDVITIDDFQVEFNKGYATPFVNGKRAGIVRDQSTQSNDAPLALANTPKWVEGGMVGKGCYEFDGVNAKIDTDRQIKHIGRTYTVSFWASYSGSMSDGYRAMIGGRESSAATEFFIGKNSGNGNIGVQDGTYYESFVPAAIHNAFDGNLHHHCLVMNNGSGIYYVDAVQKGGPSSFSGCNAEEYISIGFEKEGSGAFWKGQIDDVRIYTTALSAEEIKELYQQRASLDSGGNLLC